VALADRLKIRVGRASMRTVPSPLRTETGNDAALGRCALGRTVTDAQLSEVHPTAKAAASVIPETNVRFMTLLF